MEHSSRKGLRIFMAILLALSLMGTSGTQAISQAFADDVANAANGNANAGGGAQSPGDGTTASSPSFTVPEERYVRDYVYGVFSDEYTLMSDKAPIGTSEGCVQEGILVSRTNGIMLPDNVVVNCVTAAYVIDNGWDYIPCKLGDKWGLWDLKSKAYAVQPRFDDVSSVDTYYWEHYWEPAQAPTPDGAQWGFVEYGTRGSNGYYPNAKAYIFSGSQEVFQMRMERCRVSSFWYSSYEGCWLLRWEVGSDEDYSIGDESWRIENNNGKLVASCIYAPEPPEPSDSTERRWLYWHDGRYALLEKDVEGTIHFSIGDADGNWSAPVTIATDNQDLDSFHSVSNLIGVSPSNGFDYQYFKIDGALLHSTNDHDLTGFGDYAAYERIDFATQETTWVFLDTSDAGRDALEIPVLKGQLSSWSWPERFECLSKDRKVRIYDTDFKILAEIEVTDEFYDAIINDEYGTYWEATDLAYERWMLKEFTEYEAMDAVFCKGSKSISYTDLGLDSFIIKDCAVSDWGEENGDGLLCLIDDSGRNKARFYDKEFAFKNEIDLPECIKDADAIDYIGIHRIHDSGSMWGAWELVICTRDNEHPLRTRLAFLDRDLEFVIPEGCDTAFIRGCVNIHNTSYGEITGLLDDSGKNILRLYDEKLGLKKELDLSSRLSQGEEIEGFGNPDHLSSDTDWSIRDFGISTSDHGWITVCISRDLELLDYDGYSYETFGNMHICTKNGKWGFVDANFKPLSDFKYDSICSWNDFMSYKSARYDLQSRMPWIVASEGDKMRLFDNSLKDLLGYAFDDINPIGSGYLLVQGAGSLHVLDPQLKEVDLRGYKPATDDHGYGYYWDRVRTLPDGTTMIYAQNAQGKYGAISTSGKVIIPFEYKDYAEQHLTATDVDATTKYIMLRDDKGWFFVSIDELAGIAPNEDCATAGHAYEATVHEPTCTLDGYTQYVCTRCGDAYRDESSTVTRLGHDFALVSEATSPTCTEDAAGAKYACTRCDETKQDDGYEPKLGHEWGDWTTDVVPTCTTVGTESRTCSRCDEVEEREIAAHGHDWSVVDWAWSDDFSSATATRYCLYDCGESQSFNAEMQHESVEGGTRHSAHVLIDGVDYHDGKLAIGWRDKNGIVRNMVVQGTTVAEGFYVWVDGLELPANVSGLIEMNVDPVTEGGVFDALVAKIGSGWPAGTFDVRLNVGGQEMHDGFGTLAFAFPAGVESAGKKATIHHCHKNDRSNISSHDLYVEADGMVVIKDIVDLSTFALELYDEDAVIRPGGGGAPGSEIVTPTPGGGLGSSPSIQDPESDPIPDAVPTADSDRNADALKGQMASTGDSAQSQAACLALVALAYCIAGAILLARSQRKSS